ncbi:Rpa49 subunit specific to nuclear RNA polymerase I [Cyathus striatus]|nr:Rpa49 subunit specific to nuclear RNA polymerase I [Cyathus striatus]
MSETKASSKKRKRDASPPHNDLTFQLSSTNLGILAPTLVSYPAIQPPPTTSFKCYAQKRSKTSSETDDNKRQKVIVAGETPVVEFVTNVDESSRAADDGCRYLLATYNHRTGSLTVLSNAQAPHILTRTVKNLKTLEASAVPSSAEYRVARTNLGETFGTKKAKAAIRAQERNRVDVGAMEGVMDYVMEGITKGAEGLMSKDEAKEAADTNRLIPPFSAIATNPADVYPLHHIIPETEWKSLSTSAFDQADSDRDRIAMLPSRKSNWVKDHLRALMQDASKNKKNIKILLYVSAMFAFREIIGRRQITKEDVHKNLSGVPSIVIDSLISRFTEMARDSSAPQVTTATKTNLLTHIFALCLKLDNFATDTELIAQDLSMKVAEVNQLFKSLGCKITVLTEKERIRLGLPDSSAGKKRAVLNAPVVFPKPRLKRKTKT